MSGSSLEVLSFLLPRLGVWLTLLLAAFAIGFPLVRRPLGASRLERTCLAATIGLGGLGWLGFLIGQVGGLRRVVVVPLLLGLAAGGSVLAARTVRVWWREATTRGPWLGLSAVLFGLLAALALYPEASFDAANYHLPFAESFIASGSIEPAPVLRFPVFPVLWETLFALAFLFGGEAGEAGARLLQATTVPLIVGLLVAWGRRISKAKADTRLDLPLGVTAASLWLGIPLVWSIATRAYVDLGLTLFVTASLFGLAVAEASKRSSARLHWLAVAGFAGGFAAATKYLGLFFLAFLMTVQLIRAIRFRRLRLFLVPAPAASLAGGPFYLWILVETGNPVFPFFESLFGASEWTPHVPGAPDGQGHFPGSLGEWLEALVFLALVPWNGVFDREVFNLQAPHSPWFLLALPTAIAASVAGRGRKVASWAAGLMIAYALFWLGTMRDPRFLLPLSPLLVLWIVGCAGPLLGRVSETPRLSWLGRRWGVTLVLLALVAPGVGWVFWTLYERGPLPLNRTEREIYLERQLRGYAALDWLNERYGTNSRVYGLYAERLRYYARGELIGDWYGPLRYERVLVHADDPDALVSELRAMGVDHLLVLERSDAVVPAFPLEPVLAGEGWWLYSLAEARSPALPGGDLEVAALRQGEEAYWEAASIAVRKPE